ncbi:MAG: AtpZ/AtpI family protein [Chloroflexota bacterium]
MAGSDKKPESEVRRDAFNFTLAAIIGQVGCLTVIIIVIALFLGISLDNAFESRPWFTIILLVGSVPVTLVVMFWATRWTTSKMKIPEPVSKESPQEEEEIGRNS